MMMTGASACPSNSFSVNKTYPGACTESYTLSGTFTSATTFTGNITISYTGGAANCGDCTGGSWSVSGTKQ